MNSKCGLLKSLVILPALHCSALYAAEEIDTYFDKSLSELASIPVTIASVTPTTTAKSSSVTSVITAEQIKAMGATQLHEVLETVPGIHASLQDLAGDYNYTVRGIRNSGNSQLLMMLNNTRINSPASGTLVSGLELPIESIKQIEIIRGPASALYGADAFVGVVNIITKKAQDINGVKLGVRAGNFGNQSGWGQYGKKWAGWDVAASLQYQHADNDGSRVLKKDIQSEIDKLLRTNASNAPGVLNTHFELFNGHLNLKRKHWDIGFWGTNVDSGNRVSVFGSLDPDGVINSHSYLANIKWSSEDLFDQWQFGLNASYQNNVSWADMKIFPNGAYLPVDANGNVTIDPVYFKSFPNGAIYQLSSTEHIPTIQFSTLYKGLNRHQLRLVSGFRFEETHSTMKTNYGFGAFNPNNPVIGAQLTDVSGTKYSMLPDKNRSVWSVALQDEWQLTDNVQLITGLRYDKYSDFGDTVNPRAALVWNINKQLTHKVLFGRAFRAPNLFEQVTRPQVKYLTPGLKPETIETFEWAMDYQEKDYKLSTNIYYYYLRDFIATKSYRNFNFINSGAQQGYGVEVEASWQINKYLKTTGNYAWQHSKVTSNNTMPTGVPVNHVYAALYWQFLPKWQLQTQFNWVGGRITPIAYNGSLDDYHTIDFTLRGKNLFNKLTLAGSLRNAFDTRYCEPAYNIMGNNIPMPGRTFYIEASINF